MKTIQIFWSFFLLGFFINPSFGQDDYRKKVIIELNKYRLNLITDSIFLKEISNMAYKYNALTDWSGINVYYDLSLLYLRKNLTEADIQYLKKLRTEKFQDESEIKQELEYVNNHPELYMMMNEKFISRDYPYRLSLQHFMIEEMVVCKVDSNHRVAEIGAGDGHFAYLLNRIFKPKVYHLNEIDTPSVYFFPRIKNLHLDSLENEYKLIHGETNRTNLSGQYDKIIIRNTFHHFRKKKKMLENIKQHLAPNGEIVVIEVFKEDAKFELDDKGGAYSCYMQISENEFLRCFEKINFKLISKSKVQNRSMFVFKVKENITN